MTGNPPLGSDFQFAINHIRPGLFSRSPGPEGSEARMPKIKVNINQIEMKLCMSHYTHKSMPDAKFASGRFSRFGDMTLQNFHQKKGMSHKIRLFTPRKMCLT